MIACNGFKVAALTASIALAMGSTAVLATAPTTSQLPGHGAVAAGSIDTAATGVTTDGKTLNIALTADSVIKWGTGTDINKTGTAGFNIGADATVAFSGAHGVLNIDTTGNPSQIFGNLTSAATPAASGLFVANENGIIVGPNATIQAAGTGDVGLIGNTLGAGAFSNTASLTYNGTSTGSGDVTVQSGATIKGTNVIVAGAGNVNVDLGAVTGNVLLTAGLSTGGAFAVTNPSASLAVTGGGIGVVTRFGSAGTATTHGTLDLSGAGAIDVAGLLTNSGDLTLGAVNGAVHNRGQLSSAGTIGFTALTNDGAYFATGVDAVSVTGGDFTNNGEMTADGRVTVTNGSIVNNGTIAGADDFEVASDSTLASFAKGADYSISNTGTVTSPDYLMFDANTEANQTTAAGLGHLNGSTGSFTNTGKLQVVPGGGLYAFANNDINLGGLVQINDGGTIEAVSAIHPLGNLQLQATYYITGNSFASDGVLTVSTPLAVENDVWVTGNQVKLMDNLSGVDATGAYDHDINILAGAAQATDYTVRVASGKTISARGISVYGNTAEENPNVILQGTVSADTFHLGDSSASFPGAISDLYSGPTGGIRVTGTSPHVYVEFTGAIKTAKYLNDPNNFRYNDLPITVDGTGPLQLSLNPTAFKTNGTSNGLSAVNILVDGDVDLASGVSNAAPTTAVTGVTHWENTHLVLQSTGDIATTTAFYWPGYIYLGTIDADAGGNALPGTLSVDGTIMLAGDFNNVLPGDVAGASGIHFMTGNPLDVLPAGTAYQVTTNANAWINFPNDLLRQIYAQDILGNPTFFGGVASGLIVNYGKLDVSNFHTQPVDATR